MLHEYRNRITVRFFSFTDLLGFMRAQKIGTERRLKVELVKFYVLSYILTKIRYIAKILIDNDSRGKRMHVMSCVF